MYANRTMLKDCVHLLLYDSSDVEIRRLPVYILYYILYTNVQHNQRPLDKALDICFNF